MAERFRPTGPKGDPLQNRKPTPGYLFFFLLFLPDTWQILIAFVVSVLLTPRILPADVGTLGATIVYVMVAGNLYVLARPVGRRISAFWKRLILAKRA